MFPSFFEVGFHDFHCGFGWTSLIHYMLLILKKNNSNLRITYIKEKYRFLHISYTGDDDFGEQVIRLAESASAYICESCGKAGREKDLDGWYKTLCDDPQCHSYD